MSTKIFILLSIIITIIGLVLRVYKVTEVPLGLQQDETSIGYNAYSILETTKDEYGQSYPVQFRAFGEQKLPGYIYLSVISFGLLGPTTFALRIVSVLFGSSTILLTIILTWIMFGASKRNFTIALFSGIFLALMPWHIHFSRGAFEVVPALFFLTAGVLATVAATNKKQISWWFISIICFIASMYTYNITRILAPLLAIASLYIYRSDNVPNKWQVSIGLLLSTVLLLPFILTLTDARTAISGTLLHTSAPIQAQVLEYRSHMLELPPLVQKMFFNNAVLTLGIYLYHIISYLSVSFLFISGSSHGNHGIGTHGQLYLYSLPLLVIALYTWKKIPLKAWRLLCIWWIGNVAIAAFTREAPHATRGFFTIIPLSIILAHGAQTLLSWIMQQKRIIQQISICISVVITIISFAYFWVSYYYRFPVQYAPAWRVKDEALTKYLQAAQPQIDQILIDPRAGYIYTSYLFYSKFSPTLFQNTVVRTDPDSEGFTSPIHFGNVTYKEIDWPIDLRLPRTVIVTKHELLPVDISSNHTIFYPRRPVVLAKGQEIYQFPVEDIAYVVVFTEKQ